MRLDQIVKGGSISPTDVALNGVLTPTQAKIVIKAIVDNSGWLKKITVDRMSSLTKNRTGVDIGTGILRRHISGEKPTKTKTQAVGAKLNASNGVVLMAGIDNSTIIDNQNNKDFENEQFGAFSVAFSNDLVYLGFVGVSDSVDVDAEFKDLAKGWAQIAKDSDKTIKIVTTHTTMLERLKELVKKIPDDIIGDVSIVMSRKDHQDYIFELSDNNDATALLINAKVDMFAGIPIEIQSYMPTNTLIATPLKNFVFGMAGAMERNRWYDNEESQVKYKFVVHPDYEFDLHKFVVISYKDNLADDTSNDDGVADDNS